MLSLTLRAKEDLAINGYLALEVKDKALTVVVEK